MIPEMGLTTKSMGMVVLILKQTFLVEDLLEIIKSVFWVPWANVMWDSGFSETN